MQWIPSEKKEQPEQEPAAWQVKYRDDEGMPQIAWFPHPVHPKSPLAKKPYTEEPLYTAPPQPKPNQEPVAYMGNGIMSPASVLEMTRNAFGLNVSDLADVFQTTRQTVYQWMKLSDMEQVRSHAHLERIKVVYRATQFWNEQPILKGRWSKAILPTGVTMLDILKANQIDLDTLKAAHAVLSGSSAQPEQEPVAWELRAGKTDRVLIEITNNPQRAHDWKASLEEVVPLYAAPPQREWVGLTEEEKESFWKADQMTHKEWDELFADVEAKLREKNGG